MISFYPNCTLPLQAPAFVAAPDVRGTLDILWSCLSLIVLCTWSVLVLPVPPQFEPKNERQKLCKTAYLLGRKLKYMVITILSPELLLGLSMSSFSRTRKSLGKARKLAEEDGVLWSMAHSFLANNRGFVLRFEEDLVAGVKNNEANIESTKCGSPTAIADGTRNIVVHSKLEEVSNEIAFDGAIMTTTEESETHNDYGIDSLEKQVEQTPKQEAENKKEKEIKNKDYQGNGEEQKNRHSRTRNLYGETPLTMHARHISFVEEIERHEPDFFRQSVFKRAELRENIFTLDADSLIYARERGFIEKLPSLSDIEIDDRNKSDSFIKLITVAQIMWQVGQLIDRAASGKPSTQLEISTIAFAFCAVLIYILLFNLPKDVMGQTYIMASRPIRDWQELREFSKILPNTPEDDEKPEAALQLFNSDPWIGAGLTVGGTMFGSLHLLAWNLSYPTDVEKTIWRACALYMTVYPLCAFSGGTLVRQAQRSKRWQKWSTLIWKVFQVVITFFIYIYVLCRIYILIEIFRSLYYQPPGVYDMSAANNAPTLS